MNQVLNKIMDAYGLTVKAEIANVKKYVFGCVLDPLGLTIKNGFIIVNLN